MHAALMESDATPTTPLIALPAAQAQDWLNLRTDDVRKMAEAQGFKGARGDVALFYGPGGIIERVVVGLGEDGAEGLSALPLKLPAGDYRLLEAPDGLDPTQMAIAWARGAYQFGRYKKPARGPARLVMPEGADVGEVLRVSRAEDQVREMVDTPACDMGPKGVETRAREIFAKTSINLKTIVGDALVEANYPLIHAVGRAANESPRLMEFTWGKEGRPRIAIIGKGVTFDTGGLNIKTGNSMRLMKKDMGGAAHALALARMIVSAELPVDLHVVVPLAENAIGKGAFRPGDILQSRAGKTVEIDNTDAEGRLILADALTRAGEREPELVLDFATLTGAARVALGADIAPFYTHDDSLALDLERAGKKIADPLWRMPLWPGYRGQLRSPIADLKNTGDDGMAGSITAALFLEHFVTAPAWAHFDIYSWRPAREGQPAGARAQAIRAVFEVLKKRYPPADA